LREVFTAAVLLLVIGIALLMTKVGLSPALGAFLAGVVLANSEYRPELEADIEPFKGLLLGLFFIAVGASIDFSLIGRDPGLIAGATMGVLALKFSVLLALAKIFRLGTAQALLFAFALPQVGEFAFVLLSFASQEGVLGAEITRPMTVVTALSMALTPLLLLLNERVVLPRFGTRRDPEREADPISERNTVLIAGFGAFGSTVGRLLRAKEVGTTVLEMDSDRVELLRRLGLHVYYGDATRHDLLEAAGANSARLLIIALDSPERTLDLAKMARRNFPHLILMARAFDWDDAHDLQEVGVDYVYRQSLDTSLRLGTDALRLLGHRSHNAVRAAETFLRHDEASLSHLTAERRLRKSTYLSEVRRHIEDLEGLLLSDRQKNTLERDAGWDPESLREEFRDGS
jgi:voltage-gated potassium channel Kch